MRSISSNTIHSVRIARFNSEVKAMSKLYPCFLSRRPASLASSFPFSDRSTSVQPVNRFSLFQTLSPWRSRTILCISILLFLEKFTSTSAPALSFHIVGVRRTGTGFVVAEISDVILLIMGEEEKHFGFCLHRKMVRHPQASRDGHLFKFELRSWLYPCDETLDPDWTHNFSFCFHPVEIDGIDPERALHASQCFGVSVGRTIIWSRCTFQDVDFMTPQHFLSH